MEWSDDMLEMPLEGLSEGPEIRSWEALQVPQILSWGPLETPEILPWGPLQALGILPLGPLEGEQEYRPEDPFGAAFEVPLENPLEGYSETFSEDPTESWSESGLEVPSDFLMQDAHRIPITVTNQTGSSSNPNTAKYGNLNPPVEDSEWAILAIMWPIPTSINGSSEMTLPPPLLPPQVPWGVMEGIEFMPSIPRVGERCLWARLRIWRL